MDIRIENLQIKVPLNRPMIKTLVSMVLLGEKISEGDIGIFFVSRQRIHALNRRYLQHNYATDVIAFDLSIPKSLPLAKRPKTMSRLPSGRQPIKISGDIFVSTDAALQNSKTFGTSLAEEMFLYIVHGLLHLLGYDDHAPADIRQIRDKEQAILTFIGKRVERIVA